MAGFYTLYYMKLVNNMKCNLNFYSTREMKNMTPVTSDGGCRSEVTNMDDSKNPISVIYSFKIKTYCTFWIVYSA